ncbi:MAG: hypothetical protein IIB03_01350 [Acidobacteria bacterium]|nr:hypothetical protein [Acidobacteriota bacterium]
MSCARRTIFSLVVVILVFSTGLAGAQEQDFDSVEIGTIEVAQGIYMLTGSGGNIGVSAGEAGVVIVAHENVRARMSAEQFLEFFGSRVPPSPKVALPVVTFSDAVTFYFNGEEIHVAHFPPAHTDGDSVIHFRQANVIHTGDLFTYQQYPFIDVATGGSINGMIAGAKRLLSMVNEDTRLIPGHGPLGDPSRLLEFHDMLVTIRDRIVDAVEAGQTLDEIVQAVPAREFDAKWGQKFLSSEQFVRLVHSSLRSSRLKLKEIP